MIIEAEGSVNEILESAYIRIQSIFNKKTWQVWIKSYNENIINLYKEKRYWILLTKD